MSSNNSGGGHDGQRGKSASTGGSQKRHRSPTSDDDISQRPSLRRRIPRQTQMQRLQAYRQAHGLEATVTVAEGRKRLPSAQSVNLSVGSMEEAGERMKHANPAPTWFYGEIQPPMISRRLFDGRESYRSPSSSREAKRRIRAARAANITQIMRDKQRPQGEHCSICKSHMHDTKRCSALLGPGPFTERQQGFKRWCPRHLTASHSMDECKQKWTWLRDPKHVIEMLVENCGAGPTFATNLIDWRCLLDVLPANLVVKCFPWTPEFAIVQKREEPNFHERNIRALDPACLFLDEIKSIREWQTENGQAPQFKSYAELKAYAEQEHQKFQREVERKRQLAAEREEHLARAAEEYKQILIQQQSIDKQAEAFLHKHANDPECMKLINGVAETMSREKIGEEVIERVKRET